MLVFCKEQTTTDVYFNSFFLSGINWCADFQPIGLLAVYRLFSCQPVLDDSFSAIDTSIQWTAGKTSQEIFLYILSAAYLCTDAAGAMDFNINQKGVALICFYLKLCSVIFFDAFSLLASSVTAVFFSLAACSTTACPILLIWFWTAAWFCSSFCGWLDTFAAVCTPRSDNALICKSVTA